METKRLLVFQTSHKYLSSLQPDFIHVRLKQSVFSIPAFKKIKHLTCKHLRFKIRLELL